MTGNLAIIGNGECVVAFKAGGVDAYFADDEKKARELLKKLAQPYKVIYVTDDLARSLDDIIQRTLENPYPVIVPVPGENGASGYAIEKMKEQAERALGVDVLFNR